MAKMSLADLYLRASKESKPYIVVKADDGDSFFIKDGDGNKISRDLNRTELRIARRNALTALKADPNTTLAPELRALIRFDVNAMDCATGGVQAS